jgi:2-keto-4-pentenoate hydratase/2-oxohepta-3-ene-1,7-dioic acid hydratase in catechol pathway
VKVLCVGQNYAKHVAEVPGTPSAERPTWFWKPDTAIVLEGEPIRLPTDIGSIHHEVELAIRIGDDGQPDAFTVAIDITAREMQSADKKAGRPWQQAKGYDTFLPLGEWNSAAGVNLQDLQLRLSVNGEVRQDGSTSEMTWPIASLLDEAAKWTTLLPGDVLLTGTPHGVSAMAVGDNIVAEVVGQVRREWVVEART